jgi:sugar O-acyltransferase (sialic acid O-acetyltransferase NeuD family)
MKRIVIWGAGGHAKVVAATVRRLGTWQIEGFIDALAPERAGQAFEGASVLGGREVLSAVAARGVREIALAFGHNAARLALGTELAAQGWHFPPLVDPTAVVADGVALGAGTYVAPAAVINPGASIGAHVIVNTGAIVEHDVELADGVHVCPRACLAGHATVGRGAWVGADAGAVAHQRAGAFIGIGALVIDDVPDGMLAQGHPARVIRKVDT